MSVFSDISGELILHPYRKLQIKNKYNQCLWYCTLTTLCHTSYSSWRVAWVSTVCMVFEFSCLYPGSSFTWNMQLSTARCVTAEGAVERAGTVQTPCRWRGESWSPVDIFGRIICDKALKQDKCSWILAEGRTPNSGECGHTHTHTQPDTAHHRIPRTRVGFKLNLTPWH